MSLFKIRPKTVKGMVKVNILWSENILLNRPTPGSKPKEGGASKKVLLAQKRFPQPMSDRSTMER
jgi:hypothetical protein